MNHLFLSLLLAASPVHSADSPDALMDALGTELDRSARDLELGDSPPPYHVRYTLSMAQNLGATASYGALVNEWEGQNNWLGVEVRVGSPEFDSANLGGWENGFVFDEVPDLLSAEALRQSAWLLTDRAYKDALEQLARKSANVSRADYPGDYLLTGPVSASERLASLEPSFDPAVLARALSAELPKGLELAEVHIDSFCGGALILDTEGTRVSKSRCSIRVRALAHARAEDGVLLTDQRLWMATDAKGLPPAHVMQSAVKEMGESLLSLRLAPLLEDEYVGPVLFLEDAAVDLFRYLLVHQLEGTPPVIPFDTFLGGLGGDKFSTGDDNVRLNRRVLPAGWSVFDDPSADLEFPGAYRYDDEGTPAQRVELVVDGIVRDLLMSRVPRKGLRVANGHGVGGAGNRKVGRAANLEIRPDRAQSTRQLRRQALRTAAAYGRDWILEVRRIQDPAVQGQAENDNFVFGFLMDSGPPALPPPVAIFRVYADGREQRLRGATFSGAERWLLRDIVAAGRQVSADYLAGASDSSGDITSGHPVRIRCPEVLVGEVELIPMEGDPDDAPLLALPL